MRAKCLVAVMSLFLMLGLSTPAAADWITDPIGDTANNGTVGNYDIEKAKVDVYPDDFEFMNVCLKMTDSSTLPGIVIFEFDVDSDTVTGGGVSMVGIFKACEGTDKIKVQPGIDIVYMLMLRDQGDTAPTAWCSGGCLGPGGNCFIKDTPCDGACSGTGACYKANTTCQPDSGPNCYVTDLPCQTNPTLCEKCYEMTQVCASCSVDCAIGRAKGEWYVTATVSGTGVGQSYPDVGRIDPLPEGPGDDNADCYKVAWARVVQNAYDYIVAAGIAPSEHFDLAKAQDPANYLKWQVSTWHDLDFGTTGNDYMDIPNMCLEVTDVVPNSGSMAPGQVTDGGLCHAYQGLHHACMDLNADGSNVEMPDSTTGCYFNVSITDQSTCEAAGCTWYGAKDRCVADMCVGDTTFDGKIKGKDKNIPAKDYGRPTCPYP
jgi:hypothetical protein